MECCHFYHVVLNLPIFSKPNFSEMSLTPFHKCQQQQTKPLFQERIVWKPWCCANITPLLVPDVPQWGFANRFLMYLKQYDQPEILYGNRSRLGHHSRQCCFKFSISTYTYFWTVSNCILVSRQHIGRLSFYIFSLACFHHIGFHLGTNFRSHQTLVCRLDVSWSDCSNLHEFQTDGTFQESVTESHKLLFFLLQFLSPQMVWWFKSVWLSNHNAVYAACRKESAFRQTFVLSYFGALLLKSLNSAYKQPFFFNLLWHKAGSSFCGCNTKQKPYVIKCIHSGGLYEYYTNLRHLCLTIFIFCYLKLYFENECSILCNVQSSLPQNHFGVNIRRRVSVCIVPIVRWQGCFWVVLFLPILFAASWGVWSRHWRATGRRAQRPWCSCVAERVPQGHAWPSSDQGALHSLHQHHM